MSTVGLFSKRDWETQSERIPGLINIARIAILFSLLVIQIAGNYADSDGPLAIFPPAEFYSWAAVYGVLILVTVLKPEWQRQTLDFRVQFRADVENNLLLEGVVDQDPRRV